MATEKVRRCNADGLRHLTADTHDPNSRRMQRPKCREASRSGSPLCYQHQRQETAQKIRRTDDDDAPRLPSRGVQRP